ncbi:MAG TPA: ribosome biogenesis GTPase Der [Spirochaetota bacterium]
MSNALPIVSIAGRRNVGKSTLFNALVRSKIAIVDDFPGLTRDILTYRVTHNDQSFILCDTPGLDLPDDADLSEKILANAHEHLSKSAAVILLLENPSIAPFDHDLIELLRKMSIPTIVAVNKMDSPENLENMSGFYETGLSDILPISAKFRKNLDLLTDKVIASIPEISHREENADLRIAIVGRPNAGKSTLLNAFLGYDRSIVSDVPGTTRDSVNESFTFQGKRIEVIDTAGLRKRSKIKEDFEFFSISRTIESIHNCDLVFHLVDATQGLCDNDKKIADEIIEARRPMIIALNKWDLIEKDTKTFEEFKEELVYSFYRAADFPIISISAKDKQRIHKLMTTAIEISEKASRRIETGKLNRALEEIAKSGRLPGFGTKYKVYYATQIDTIPPQFKFFVNKADQFRSDVVRFFEKEFQRMMDLKGVPIIIKIEGKEKGKRRVPRFSASEHSAPRPKKDRPDSNRKSDERSSEKRSSGDRASKKKFAKVNSKKGTPPRRGAGKGGAPKGNGKRPANSKGLPRGRSTKR